MFAIEVVEGCVGSGLNPPRWVPATFDGETPATYAARGDAEAEARFAFGDDVEWRVVEVSR